MEFGSYARMLKAYDGARHGRRAHRARPAPQGRRALVGPDLRLTLAAATLFPRGDRAHRGLAQRPHGLRRARLQPRPRREGLLLHTPADADVFRDFKPRVRTMSAEPTRPRGRRPPSAPSCARPAARCAGRASTQSTRRRASRAGCSILEEDRHGDFAAPVYLHGFLKSYCDHLELDYLPLWQRVAPPRTRPMPNPGTTRGRASRLATPGLMPCSCWGPAGRRRGGLGVSRFLRTREQGPGPSRQRRPPPPSNPPPRRAVVSDSSTAFVGPRAMPLTPSRTHRLSRAPAHHRHHRRPGHPAPRRATRLRGRLPPGKHLDWRGTAFILHASNPKGCVELGGRRGPRRPASRADGSLRLGK